MKYLSDEISIANTVELAGGFKVNLYDNSIIEVQWDPELKEVEKFHMVELTRAIKILGNGKPMRVYSTVYDFMSFSEEARAYSVTEQAERYTLANAVLIDSLGKKILFNFYLKFNKPNNPIRAFSHQDQAFEWLLSLQDD
jgi:hypothetical protein